MTNYNSWMSDRLGKYGLRTLKELALPGSHDSGMSSPHSPFGMGSASTTKTQSMTVAQQLQAGCRYFDIRVMTTSGQPRGRFYSYHGDRKAGTFHGAVGESMQEILDAIYMALLVNKELVVLKLSHFEQFSSSDHDQLLGLVAGRLQPCLPDISPSANVLRVPLRRLLMRNDGTMRGTVIVLHTDLREGRKARHPNIFFARDQDDSAEAQAAADVVSYDNYSNSDDAAHVMQQQLEHLGDAALHGNRLFTLAWTLTESGGDQFGSTVAEGALHFFSDPVGTIQGALGGLLGGGGNNNPGTGLRPPNEPPLPAVNPVIVKDAHLVTDHMDRIVAAVPSDAIDQNLVPNIFYIDDYHSAATDIAIRINDKIADPQCNRNPKTRYSLNPGERFGLTLGESLTRGQCIWTPDFSVRLLLDASGSLKLLDMSGETPQVIMQYAAQDAALAQLDSLEFDYDACLIVHPGGSHTSQPISPRNWGSRWVDISRESIDIRLTEPEYPDREKTVAGTITSKTRFLVACREFDRKQGLTSGEALYRGESVWSRDDDTVWFLDAAGRLKLVDVTAGPPVILSGSAETGIELVRLDDGCLDCIVDSPPRIVYSIGAPGAQWMQLVGQVVTLWDKRPVWAANGVLTNGARELQWTVRKERVGQSPN